MLRPLRLGAFGAAVAGGNGALSGWRGIYDWRRPRGVAGYLLDSTWNLVGITGSLVVHGASHLGRDPGYVAELSHRSGFHVYRRGAVLRRGFALCVGNVVTGAAGRSGLDPSSEAGRRRRRMIVEHEGLHVWQQRALGPCFPLLYGGWMLIGAVAGVAAWAVRRDRTESLFRTVERLAYSRNPFEVSAYRRTRR